MLPSLTLSAYQRQSLSISVSLYPSLSFRINALVSEPIVEPVYIHMLTGVDWRVSEHVDESVITSEPESITEDISEYV